jgi:hypothetical protein
LFGGASIAAGPRPIHLKQFRHFGRGPRDGRYTPESGHFVAVQNRSLWAISDKGHRSKSMLVSRRFLFPTP